MKKALFICLTLLFGYQCLLAKTTEIRNEPDSAYIFAYATTKDNNHNGLHFAWSVDTENWHPIGPEHSFLRCDYGRWGLQKRMINPVLISDKNGAWHCLWTINETDPAIAYTTSEDLINWKPQAYPLVASQGNCMAVEASQTNDGNYHITWVDTQNSNSIYSTRTKDFKNFTPAEKIGETRTYNQRDVVSVNGNEEAGTIHKVAWSVIDKLIKTQQEASYKHMLYSESTATDAQRFAGLKPVDATITIAPERSKPISDMLIGIFFEDINYAADGGIYAELIQNRGFEYALSDKEGHDPSWNSTKAWKLNGANATFKIDTVQPIHPNNKHYAKLVINETGAALTNEGFNGIALKAGDKYDFSIFARTPEAKKGKLKVRLTGKNGEVYGEATTKNISSDWKKYEVVVTSNKTVDDAQLEVIPQMTGTVQLDMISLFPQKTFKGRKNGLRPDLAQTLADLKPRFVRFPGGCVAHGDGLGNMYRWKNTIGELEARKPQRNLWGYHQTAGLGYYEYFQFCEDIGAEPLPVLPAGVPCQNSAHHGHALGGQQCGIPMEEMGDYIQEVLDLIEWANGDAKTTFWGKKRAEAGHPKPFNLKYLGIGNEDLISEVFEERYVMICNAVREKYPDIVVIGTVGPFYEGSDYTEGWRIATEINLPMVDEHYYNSPGWYIHNQNYYDRYDRNKPKVYLGEYAAHLPGRPVNIETALAEALHLANVERNGDVVSLTSYAPLLAKEGFTQWNPDLIYFNNTEVKPTVSYYVQKLYGQNSGDEYLPSFVKLSNERDAVKKRIAVSVVKDSKTNDYIVKMVNFLPVAVNTNIDLTPLGITKANAELTVLHGAPDDKTAKPQASAITVSSSLAKELPAYSFTVLRIKNNK